MIANSQDSFLMSWLNLKSVIDKLINFVDALCEIVKREWNESRRSISVWSREPPSRVRCGCHAEVRYVTTERTFMTETIETSMDVFRFCWFEPKGKENAFVLLLYFVCFPASLFNFSKADETQVLFCIIQLHDSSF